MKSFKLYIILLAIFSGAGLYAQVYSTYKVKGLVIDTRGEGVEGAVIKSNKTKLSVSTQKGGVFSITIADKDTELRLYINKSKIMALPISSEIAKKPVVFALDENNDPSIKGRKVGDTYYPGSEDKDLISAIENNFPGCKFSVDALVLPKYDPKSRSNITCNKYILDGHTYDRMPAVEISRVYSITVSSYNREVKIITRTAHEATTQTSTKDQYARLTGDDDSLRGVVTDGWGRRIPGLMIRTSSGETAMSDTLGNYAIKITKKDKYLRCVMDYTEGTTVRISQANIGKPVNLTVMLYEKDLRGRLSDDRTSYFPGAADTWESIFSYFPGAKYHKDVGRVMFDRHKNTSINNVEPPYALNVLNNVGMEELTLEDLDPHSFYNVKIIPENAIPLYGAAAQYGAIVLTSKGIPPDAPVERTDFTALRAKQRGDMKGFIAAQGKNLEYEDGYIKVNGEVCQLYIINDNEYSHMRGIDVEMIDEIMILNDDMTKSYGPKAKHGVVLISASQKEKRVIDEEGNTVTEKEYKKAKRKK